MAKIEALIPDERLGHAIAGEVKARKKTKKFGLVFEEHLLETVRLPGLRVREGELVAQKREPGNRLWRLKSIRKEIATCDRAVQGCGERKDCKGFQAWFVPKQSPFAVLIKEKEFREFREKLKKRRDIEWVFLVTDSEENFVTMRRGLRRKLECVQLYKSYLENSRTNAEEALR